MKKNMPSKNFKGDDCGKSSCVACTNCNAVNFEEKRPESKTAALQLYAKEVENYAFYYALRMKQTQ